MPKIASIFIRLKLFLQMIVQTVQLWSVKHRLSLVSSYRISCSTNLKSLTYFPLYTCYLNAEIIHLY